MFTFSPEPTPSTRRRHKNKSFKYRHTNIFPLDLLDMGHTLGKGAYGKVYKGKLKLNPDLRIEVSLSKMFWVIKLPQSVTVSQYFEMIPSEKLVGRLRWRRAREAPAPKTWKGRLAFSWNFQRGTLTKKHCQRHNGPEGWALLTKVTSLGHITNSYTNLDQTSSESRQSTNFKVLTKYQHFDKTLT